MLHQVNIHLVIIHFVSLFFFYFGAGNCSCRCRCSSQAAGSKSESTNLKKILDEKQKQAVVLTQSSVSPQSVQKQDPASAATADPDWVSSGQNEASATSHILIHMRCLHIGAMSPDLSWGPAVTAITRIKTSWCWSWLLWPTNNFRFSPYFEDSSSR